MAIGRSVGTNAFMMHELFGITMQSTPFVKFRTFCYSCLPQRLGSYWDSIEASPIGSRLASGAFWSLFGAIISRLLTFASFVLVARVLGKETYGQFGMIQSTVAMFAVFAGFGLGQTSTKYVAELRDKDPERAGRIMSMAGGVALATGALIALIMFVFAPWLAATTLAAPELTDVLRISALIILFEAMNGAQVGALAGFESFQLTARISIWSGIASFCFVVIGVYIGGLEGSVLGLLLSRAFSWCLHHLALRSEARRTGVPFSLKGHREDLRVLWHYSLPSMLSGVLVSPTIWLCNAIVVNQPAGYAQMGIFQATGTFRQLMLFIGTALGAPLLPMLANMAGKESDRFARVNILSTWFLGTFPAVFLLGFPEVAQFVFGSSFGGNEFLRTFTLTVFSASVIVYKQGLARVLTAYGLMWWGMLSNLLWAVTMIGCTWWLAHLGAFGYAIAYAVSYVINTVIVIPVYTRKGIVPRNTLISWEAGLIWLILLGGVGINLLSFNAALRVFYMVVASTLQCALFYRLLQNKDRS